MFLEECHFIVKEKKLSKYISNGIEIFSDDENSDEENSDKENFD